MKPTPVTYPVGGAFVEECSFLPHEDALRLKGDNMVIKEVPSLKVLLTALLAGGNANVAA